MNRAPASDAPDQAIESAAPHLLRALPPHADGMRIGLLGGSFNPPHEAHRAISLFALKRLRLDRIWWLVSPGNPLKENGSLHALRERMIAAGKVAHHPRIEVSCLETVIGTRYTADTISYLRRRCSGVRFVWIMGADNLAQFNRWESWRRIAGMVPIAVVDRPPDSFRALSSIAAQALMPYRIDEKNAGQLASRRAPAWTFLTGLKSTLSSTRLRNPDGSWKDADPR